MADDRSPFNIVLGRGPDQYDLAIALEKYPDIAMRVALFLGWFSVLEVITPRLLEYNNNIPKKEAYSILGLFRNFSYKIDLIEKLDYQIHTEVNSKTPTIIKELRWANSRRNVYAHGIYSKTDMAGTVRIQSFATDSIRKTQETIVTAESIDLDISRIKKLIIFMATTMRIRDFELPNFET